MAFRTKPDMTAIWASLGDNTKPVDSYITNGWEAVKPPRQYFNWLDNRQDSALAYIYQAGIVQWDALTDYEGGAGNTSYVQGSDGLVYKAVADSGPNISGTGTKDPVVQPGNAAFWTLAFASQADIDAVEADVATLETQMGDGSGVTNPAAWRSELSVYSKAEVDAMTPAIDDTNADALQLGNKAMVWGEFTGPSSGGTTTATISFSSLATMANTNYNIQLTRIVRGGGAFAVADAPTIGSKTTTSFVITSSVTIDNTWTYSWRIIGNGTVV